MNRTSFASYGTFLILAAVCVCIFTILNLQIAEPLVDKAADVDKSIMLALNFDGGPSTDRFWHAISQNSAWVPVGVTLLLSLALYKKSLLVPTMIVVGLALTVTLADQISSSLIKPYFCRPRPSHNEEICGMLHYVNGYKGGMYGFVSSHAANAFGVFAFLAPSLRHKTTVAALFVWSCMVAYSRIYLGVHYFGDIVCGGILGITVGIGVSLALKYAYKRISSVNKKSSVDYDMKHPLQSGLLTAALLITSFYLLSSSYFQSVPITTYGIMLFK